MTSLVPIIVGFLLTTVLGGVLGTWLQQRSWDHQRIAELADRELQAADQVCQKVSQLLDKRLYRMLRLYYALRASDASASSKEVVQARLRDYDSALYEWNDQLNLNLALIGTYFGQTARDWLHSEIYETYQSVGVELEDMYRHVMFQHPVAIKVDEIEEHLNGINQQVYRLGVFMMTQLRGGHVGRAAPHPVARHTSPALVSDKPVTLMPGSASRIRSVDQRELGRVQAAE